VRHGTTDESDSTVVLGAAQYTDPEAARRERERVFGVAPSIVCHCSEVPQPNDFVAVRMPRC
jgi:phenylpropionate dioxygenase-like ring-hydroxylating dioxygenase large terminal subunit